MHVEVNTDNHITGSDQLSRQVESEVEGAVGRFGDQVIRVIVQLNDTNGHKSGDHDKRCLMEARIAGHQPVAVSHEAATLDDAIAAAADKLERSLDHILGKLGHKKGRISHGGDQTI
jgi:ribosome-associated translation inhibitor RaiA